LLRPLVVNWKVPVLTAPFSATRLPSRLNTPSVRWFCVSGVPNTSWLE